MEMSEDREFAVLAVGEKFCLLRVSTMILLMRSRLPCEGIAIYIQFMLMPSPWQTQRTL